MICTINPRLLSLYIDGRLPKEKADAIEKHISLCDSCRENKAYLEGPKAILGKLSPIEVSPGFDFEFRRKLNEAISEKKVFDLNEVAKRALDTLQDVLIPRVPVFLKAAAIILISLTVLISSNTFIKSISPSISLVQGQVEIYNPKLNKYFLAKATYSLKEGDVIRTSSDSSIEINLKNLYKIRLKENSNLKVITPSLSIAKKAKTLFELGKGEILVRIEKQFKGRTLEIKTPQCRAEALGTQFMINVAQNPDKTAYTWLGVLQGTVLAESTYKKEGVSNSVLVGSGQKTMIQENSVPSQPERLLENEWNQIKELYQLGKVPQVALLISMSETRVYELLRPAPLYIYDKKPRKISPLVNEAVKDIIEAINKNDKSLHYQAIRKLNDVVEKDPDKSYNANILLFIGAYYEYLSDHEKAIKTFKKVYENRGFIELASLAKCAEAIIYEEKLNEPHNALLAYEEILIKYPQSIEAKLAKTHLERFRR